MLGFETVVVGRKGGFEEVLNSEGVEREPLIEMDVLRRLAND